MTGEDLHTGTCVLLLLTVAVAMSYSLGWKVLLFPGVVLAVLLAGWICSLLRRLPEVLEDRAAARSEELARLDAAVAEARALLKETP